MNIKNHVQLVGHVGSAPEVKELANGGKLARFAVALNESYTNRKGEKVVSTQWHNVIAWGNVATLAQRILQKGSHVTVDGKLVNRTYTDKEGIKRNLTEIVANEFLLLGSAAKFEMVK